MILDSKLSFINHLKEKISIANKRIGIIYACLYNFLPRFTLVNIYNAYIRPHLDYGDVIYDNSSNASLSQMIESVQYNAALAVTGAMRGSSLYQELGVESLHDRRWYRKLCFYYKITHNDYPLYLTELLPIVKSSGYSLRSNQSSYFSRTERFKASFIPSSTYIWNQLDPVINSSLEIYKRALLKFIRPTSSNVYKIHHPRGLKLLTKLRLALVICVNINFVTILMIN